MASFCSRCLVCFALVEASAMGCGTETIVDTTGGGGASATGGSGGSGGVGGSTTRTCQVLDRVEVVYQSYANNVWPEMTWTGDRGFVVWTQVPPDLSESTIYLQQVDVSGHPVADPIVAAEHVWNDRARLVWTGETLLVIWYLTTTHDVFVRPFSAAGQALSDAKRIAESVGDFHRRPQLVWTGQQALAVWGVEVSEDQPALGLVALDARGDATASPITVPLARECEDLAWFDGALRAVGCSGAPGAIDLSSLDEEGLRVEDDRTLMVSLGEQETIRNCRVAADDSSLVMSWLWVDLDSVTDQNMVYLAAVEGSGLDTPVAQGVAPADVAGPVSPAGQHGLFASAWSLMVPSSTVSEFSMHGSVTPAAGGRPSPFDERLSDVSGLPQVEGSLSTLDEGFMLVWRQVDPQNGDQVLARRIGCSRR